MQLSDLEYLNSIILSNLIENLSFKFTVSNTVLIFINSLNGNMDLTYRPKKMSCLTA